MKKLMVLGASAPQAKLIGHAKELGYYVIAASIPGNYPGFEIADESVFVDISSCEQVYEAAKRLEIDGIATCCLDTGVKALGYTAERLNLVGLSEDSAEKCNDKLTMKEAFMRDGVSTAKFKKVSSIDDLDKALNELSLPVIVKAVDLQGSKGIYISETKEKAVEGLKKALESSKENFCIVEEYIVGEEFGAQAFVYNGEIVFVLPHGDITYMSNTAVPIGHYAPIELSQDIMNQTINVVTKAIRALKLNNCAVNIDLIIKNNTVYMIELTGRAGATCLPELVSIYYGINYYYMIAMMAMGEDPLIEFNKRSEVPTANCSRMLLSEKSGIVKSISYSVPKSDNIYEISFVIKKGDYINKFTNAKDRLGQIIVKADTYNECEKLICEIVDNIHIDIDES